MDDEDEGVVETDGLVDVGRWFGLVIGYDDVATEAVMDVESGRVFMQQKGN